MLPRPLVYSTSSWSRLWAPANSDGLQVPMTSWNAQEAINTLSRPLQSAQNAYVPVGCLHAGILNLFGGVLIQKKRAEQALEASGMRYTIVR
jgi:hypothetical protein